MKFGGTSVADLVRIRNVALKVKREVERGYQVAVVLSAMSGETNKLVAWARELSPIHDEREYDTVVSSGEQVTVGLLAIALQSLGIPARSWLGCRLVHQASLLLPPSLENHPVGRAVLTSCVEHGDQLG
jgi:aspartate kinase